MLPPTDKHLWSIQKPILSVFLLTFGLLLAIFIFSLHWMHAEGEQQSVLALQEQTNDLLQLLMQENYRAMEGQLRGIEANNTFIKHFQTADRKGLLQATAPIYDQWSQQQGISHLYFHNLDQTNFLRVHHPKKFGDRIDRQSLLQAKATKKATHGLELGPLGTLTLRTVVPWEVDNKMIGYLEIGKELPLLFPLISEILHSDLSLFIQKQYLDQTSWLSWRTMHSKSLDWDHFENVVLFHGPNALPPLLTNQIQSNQWQSGKLPTYQQDGNAPDHIHFFFIPILDMEQKKVAWLLVQFQDRLLENITSAHKTSVIVGTLLLTLMMGLLFNRFLLRVEKKLQKATTELRHSDSRIRAILDTALDAIISIDTQGNILEFNKAAEKIFGFHKEEVLGKEISQTIIPPELRQPHRQGLAHYLATGEQKVINQHIELEAIDNNGQRIPIEMAIIVNPGASFTFFTAFLRDISERKQMLSSLNDAIITAESSNQELRQMVILHKKAMARLETSEERFRSVTLSIQDAIIAADEQQNVIFWNPGAEKLFGYKRNEILGKGLQILIPPQYSTAHQQGFQRFAQQGHAPLLGKTTELSGLRKNGEEFPLEMSLNSWTNTDGTHFFSAVIRDITERKNNEDALQAAKEAAEAANQAKSLFLANMSHEIRTPMNTIIGMGYLLAQTPLTHGQQEQMQKIQFAAETLLGIINDILDFSKIEAGRLELEQAPFHLGEIMKKVASMVSMRADEKGVEILFALHPDLPTTLIGDALRLEQVLINLGTNAVKFTHKGEIIFRIDPIEAIGNTIQLKFSVQDSGIGLSEEQISVLFKPFVQADSSTTRNYGGTGLGLAICKNLVEMMGGTMNVTSTPNAGSEFAFILPFEQGIQENALETPQLTEHPGSLRVLVVDDNQSAREILQSMLRTLSFESVAVNSGAEAILELERVIRAKESPFDIVLLDWQMPEMNGIETARHIQNSPAIKSTSMIIMVTAYGQPDVIQEATNQGIHATLIKPVTESTLLDTILDLLGKGQANHSPTVTQPPDLHTQSSMLQGARILVVEDHDINWQVAKGILSKKGVISERAINGLDAVNRLTIEHESFDCLLMDLQMPIMDGYEATRRLRRHFTSDQLPIIAMTANALKSEKDQCFALGMNDYLTKPINVKLLFSTLIKVLAPILTNQPTSTPMIEATDAPLDNRLMNLDGINVLEALERLEDDQELLTRLLLHFAHVHATTSEQLTRHFQNGDLPGFSSLLHGLKGVTGNISADKIATQAIHIESLVRQQNLDACKAVLETLCRDLDQLIHEIELLKPLTHTATPQAMDNPAPNTLPIEPLQSLKKLLEDGDFQAKEAFASLQESLAEHVSPASLTQLKDALDTLAFANGAEIVAKLLDEFTPTSHHS